MTITLHAPRQATRLAMLLLHLLSYAATLATFLFVTLSLASGLLYIAEVIEEHSQLAKYIGRRTIQVVILLHVVFCAWDRLPIHLTALGIFCHLVYLQNLSKSWPYISLTSVKFILSCILVVVDHFAWFFYFADRASATRHHHATRSGGSGGFRGGAGRSPYRPSWDSRSNYDVLDELAFIDVATFFGVCVWLVPFFLFLSLSANDNVLPSLTAETPRITHTASSNAASPSSAFFPEGQPLPPLKIPAHPQKSSILKSMLRPIMEAIPSVGSKKSSRSQNKGLIASPTPSAPPSPLPWGSGFAHNIPLPPTPGLNSPGFANYVNTPHSPSFASPSLLSPRSPSLVPTFSPPIMPPPPQRSASFSVGQKGKDD